MLQNNTPDESSQKDLIFNTLSCIKMQKTKKSSTLKFVEGFSINVTKLFIIAAVFLCITPQFLFEFGYYNNYMGSQLI